MKIEYVSDLVNQPMDKVDEPMDCTFNESDEDTPDPVKTTASSSNAPKLPDVPTTPLRDFQPVQSTPMNAEAILFSTDLSPILPEASISRRTSPINQNVRRRDNTSRGAWNGINETPQLRPRRNVSAAPPLRSIFDSNRDDLRLTPNEADKVVDSQGKFVQRKMERPKKTIADDETKSVTCWDIFFGRA